MKYVLSQKRGVMVTFRELETTCQKVDWRVRGSLLARRVARPAALYVTWLLCRWPISANAVTGVTLIVGWAAAAILAMPGCFLSGVAALWLWYLLDHVDGQLARLRRTQSVTGVYFDYMMHHLVHPAIAFALGYGMACSTDDLRWSLAGASFAWGTMALSLTNDCRYKAFFAASSASDGNGEFSSIGRVEIRANDIPDSSHARPKMILDRLHAAHRLLLRMCEIPNIIISLSFLAMFHLGHARFGGTAMRCYVLLMAVLAPTLAVLRLAKQVWNRLPDHDYQATIFEKVRRLD
jgi:hypothetical protein